MRYFVLAGLALGLAACGDTRTERTLSGAGIGALSGAAGAEIIGGSSLGGALLGGIAGGAVGYGVEGDRRDRRRGKHRRYRDDDD